MKSYGVDWCAACEVWHHADRRRRGGQPIRCSKCGGATKRMSSGWFELELIERARRRNNAIAAHSTPRFVRIAIHHAATNGTEPEKEPTREADTKQP